MATLWRDDRTVRDANGKAVNGASIYWVQQPATTSSVPPSPLIPVATTSGGVTSTANNPQTTNGFGQCSAYMQGGIYTIVEVWNGRVQAIYTDQAIGVAVSSGTVTSVDLSMPSEFSVSNNPITTSGTLTVSKSTQAANLIYAGPSSGSAAVPTFRSLVAADLPTVTGVLIGNTGGSSGVASPGQINVTGGSNVVTCNVPIFTAAMAAVGSQWTIIIYSNQLHQSSTTVNYFFGQVSAFTSATQITVNGNLTVTETNITAIVFPSTQDNSTNISDAITAAGYGRQRVIATQQVYVYNQNFNLGNYVQGIEGLGCDQTFFVPKSTTIGGQGVFVVNQQSNYQKFSGFTLVGGNVTAADSISISAWQVTSNVVTMTVDNGVTATVGATYRVRGFASTTAETARLDDALLVVLTSSAVQFTAAFTLANSGLQTEPGAATRNINGFIQTDQSQSATGTARGLNFEDVEICYFPGDGAIFSDPYAGTMTRCRFHHNGGSGRAFVQDAISLGLAAFTSIGCRTFRNFMAGTYGYQAIDCVFIGDDTSLNGTNYFFQKGGETTYIGLDSEVSINTCPAFPGHGYRFIDHSRFTIISCEHIYGARSAVGGYPLVIDGACTNFTVLGFAIDNLSAPTIPTYAFTIAANSYGSIDNMGFGSLSSSAYLNNSTLTKLFRQNNFLTEIDGTAGANITGHAKVGTIYTTNSPNVVAGNVTALTGWGTGGVLGAVFGQLGSGKIQILTGTTPTANPTFLFTYPSDPAGNFGVTPIIVCSRGDGANPVAGYWTTSAASSTSVLFTFVGTPLNGNTYEVNFLVQGKG